MKRLLKQISSKPIRSSNKSTARSPMNGMVFNMKCYSTTKTRMQMIQQHITTPSLTVQNQRYHSTKLNQKANHNPNDTLIQTNIDGNLRSIKLNRPKSLNALNSEMISLILNQLKNWELSEAAKIVILKGNGRAFCAGGDVISLIKLAESENENERIKSIKFFHDEYILDSFIAKMKTPIVCLLNGITMGGGMGLSMHSPFRIATENTRIAMPETAIGLFPDVGATFFLPRLDGEIGTYLGLTGTNLYGWGAFQAGIASHYVPSNSLSRLEERLTALSSEATHDKINEAIEEFAADGLEAETFNRAGGRSYDIKGTKRQAIDYCFGGSSIDEIITRLNQIKEGHLFNEDSSNLKDWAHDTIQSLLCRSPSSLKLSLLAFRLGKNLSIDQCFEMEMRLAAICCDVEQHPDFVNGVKHSLIEKQKTRAPWKPEEIQLISEAEMKETYFVSNNNNNNKIKNKEIEKIIESFKKEINNNSKLGLFESFMNYPYSNQYNLPNEETIKKIILGEFKGYSGHFAITKIELIQSLNKIFHNKIGIEDKVSDILFRKTITLGPNQGHVLKWQY